MALDTLKHRLTHPYTAEARERQASMVGHVIRCLFHIGGESGERGERGESGESGESGGSASSLLANNSLCRMLPSFKDFLREHLISHTTPTTTTNNNNTGTTNTGTTTSTSSQAIVACCRVLWHLPSTHQAMLCCILKPVLEAFVHNDLGLKSVSLGISC